MHKWAIPLVWVIGLGLAIPAGALAYDSVDVTMGRKTCRVWDGRGHSQPNYWVELSAVIVAFFVPFVILIFPVIALMMQLCGNREPRLDPPHSRTAATGVALAFIFVGTRFPYEVWTLMKLFHQSSIGMKASTNWGTPYAVTNFETDIIICSIVFLACLLDPIMYFAINPDYRKGLKVVWQNLYCNKDPVVRERETEARKQRKLQQRQYPNRNRTPSGLRQNPDQQLLQGKQPIIMGSQQPGVQYYPYPQVQQPGMNPQQVPLLNTQGQPMQHNVLHPDQQFLDASFDRLSPALPPVFEFDGLKYIDTARVEPRIGYSPGEDSSQDP